MNEDLVRLRNTLIWKKLTPIPFALNSCRHCGGDAVVGWVNGAKAQASCVACWAAGPAAKSVLDAGIAWNKLNKASEVRGHPI